MYRTCILHPCAKSDISLQLANLVTFLFGMVADDQMEFCHQRRPAATPLPQIVDASLTRSPYNDPEVYQLYFEGVADTEEREEPGLANTLKGMFVLANITAENELSKEVLIDVLVPHRADSTKPSFAVNFLQSKDKQLQVAILLCTLNLIYPNCEASSTRIVRLKMLR